MKAILLSVQPKWVEKILNGEKIIEVRKTMPKCDLPIDVYIYCTGGAGKEIDIGGGFTVYRWSGIRLINRQVDKGWLKDRPEATRQILLDYGRTHPILRNDFELNGKVIAKFTLKWCEKRSLLGLMHSASDFNTFCVHCGMPNFGSDNYSWLSNYAKDKDYIYAWHISDLQIFDKPMELGEFEIQCEYDKKPCDKTFKEICEKCKNFTWELYEPPMCNSAGRKKITRPPQSWQYVEVTK